MVLTATQLDEYQQRGFTVVADLVPGASLDAYEQRFIAFARGELEPTPQMKTMRDIMVVRGAVEAESALHAVNKMINFEDDPVLYGYTLEPALVGAMMMTLSYADAADFEDEAADDAQGNQEGSGNERHEERSLNGHIHRAEKENVPGLAKADAVDGKRQHRNQALERHDHEHRR